MTTDYRIELDVYHGPLDLLLYLIKRDEIDIHDIPIAHITEQFLRYVQTLQTLDIEAAGDFLVMAATLMEIKSQMMLPREEQAAAEGAEAETLDTADPRFELVRQLLAYKRFKDAAAALDARRIEFNARFPRKPEKFESSAEPAPLDLEDISVWDLFEAFNRLMEQVGHNPRVHSVVQDDTPIELHAADIVDRLQREGRMTLQAMFRGRTQVNEMIGLFLATLELIRQRKVKAVQDRIAGEISLQVMTPEEAAEADNAIAPRAYDPSNPEHFDWPDEETKRRYVRRQERRARGEVVEEDAELDEDIKALEAEENALPAAPAPVITVHAEAPPTEAGELQVPGSPDENPTPAP